LNQRVKCARHALALDDERTTFHPVLWTEESESKPAIPTTIDDERLVEVWFVGMHANVGGGYPDDAVSFVPLSWLVDESVKRGLVFKEAPIADPDSIKLINSAQDKDGRLYDSRSGLGSYYRYGPRKVSDLCNDPDVGVSVNLPKMSIGPLIAGCCQAAILSFQWHAGSDCSVGAGRVAETERSRMAKRLPSGVG
jgi:hypothetical protein